MSTRRRFGSNDLKHHAQTTKDNIENYKPYGDKSGTLHFALTDSGFQIAQGERIHFEYSQRAAAKVYFHRSRQSIAAQFNTPQNKEFHRLSNSVASHAPLKGVSVRIPRACRDHMCDHRAQQTWILGDRDFDGEFLDRS